MRQPGFTAAGCSTARSHPAAPDGRWLAGWENRDFLELGALDTAPGAVRGVIRERLPLRGLDCLRDALELVASELVTNSVAATRESAWEASAPPVRVWLLGARAGAAGVRGFECLADEEVIDHLLAIFEPASGRGIDGRKHEEWPGRACSCGFAGSAGAELDQHFLKAFTPAGSIAPDGRIHEPVG